LLLTACSTSGDPPERLELGSVQPSDSAHVAFSVKGSNLPVGATGDVLLDGVFLSPLGSAETRHLTIPCSVSRLGDAVVLRDALPRLSLPAVFEGELGLRLAAPTSTSISTGLPMHTAFAIDGEPDQAAGRLELQRQIQAARDRLGLRVEGVPGQGLRVVAVVPEGVAFAAGVLPNDLLTRLADVPLLLESALVLPQHAGPATLFLQRKGRPIQVRLSLATESASSLDTEGAAVIILLFAVAAALLPRLPLSRRLAPSARAALPLRALSACALSALFAACTSHDALPYWLLLCAALPEALRVRRAPTRTEALHALAVTACQVLAATSCMVQARSQAQADLPLALAAAPWLWLAAWVFGTEAPGQKAHSVGAHVLAAIGMAGSAALWSHAALHPSAHGEGAWLSALAAVAVAFGLVLMRALTHERAPQMQRNVTAVVALLLAVWSPTLGGLKAPMSLLTLAGVGALLGVFVRSALQSALLFQRGESPT
jgi:hypothetical protein